MKSRVVQERRGGRRGERHRVGSSRLPLNISSIRSVTRKPPTTLIVPKVIAMTSRILFSVAVGAEPAAR